MRIERSAAGLALLVVLSPSWGCGQGPRNFRKIDNPAPLTRARAVGLGERRSDSQVVPALLSRLDDQDPVVRLAAHEELRQRTGQDFGFVPWASSEERAAAVSRWRAWFAQGTGGATPTPSIQSPAGANRASAHAPPVTSPAANP